MNLLTDKTSAAISRSMKSPAMNFDLSRLIRCASRLQQAANCEHRLPHSANTVGSRLLPLLSVVFCIAAFTTPGHAQPTITIVPTDARAAETWPGQTADTGSVRLTRTGSTASSLTVNMRLRGDAVLGADFTLAPAFVSTLTFAAGDSDIDLTLTPIDDLVTEPIETVGLTLQIPSLDVFPPPYLFSTAASLHSSAGLTIRDTALYPGHPFLTKRQRILMRRFPHRYVVVPLPITVFNDPTLPPPANTTTITWAVEASSDLRAWTEVGTTTDSEEFVDVTAGDASQRFYRFRTVPPIAP